ncbi:MAG: hypothetical protein HMLKMBBP_01556 [Planctomycetes bacterium]|nr:hypothetical protein [Planctomycetota bacterium]
MKVQALGVVSSAAAGLVVSNSTNATPSVATLNAGNRLRTGDRLAIQATTTLTAINGIWTLEKVTATTFKLLGSQGNGAFGGTPTCAVVCDRTPFMRGHSAAVVILNTPAAALFDGTLLVEGSNQTDAGWQSSPSYSDAITAAGYEAIGATGGTNDNITEVREVTMYRYMRFRCSAYTSGGASAYLVA